ncbi:MAG: hypothetical protein KGD59_15375 [Candidatus Heimdallarchaeota archaeon]|nr:hypothetical protein [Candidatus Heimdallarchaeota archaeon]MBY8995929.1 hypothetical protein [Candidatus Heimdallarchaeota archaeon]
MNKKNTSIPTIDFKLHLILFFVTGTLWAPFYNLLCFLSLNKLAKLSLPEGVPSPKNSAVGNFLLALSFVGAPFAFFRRFQLLNSYITAMNSHLKPLPKTKDKDGKEINQERLNCLKPGKFVGFAITTFLLLCIIVTSFVVSSIFIMNTGWTNEAILILLPIGIMGTFIGFGFSGRTLIEEKKWVKAFNAIAEELG